MGISGRGGSDSCKMPKIIEALDGIEVARVYSGAQFSVALSKEGTVYTWGKGENHRLGHGNEEHVRYPKVVEALDRKNVKVLGVGSMHVVALTADSEVYGWGRNDQGQLGDLCGCSIPEPALLQCLKGRSIVEIACGPSQVCNNLLTIINFFIKYS